MHVHMYVYTSQRSRSSVFLNGMSFYESGSLTVSGGLTKSTRLESQRCSYFCFLGLQECATVPGFLFMWVLNSGPHVHMENILLTELCSQFCVDILIFNMASELGGQI